MSLGIVACYGATYSPRIPHQAHRVDPQSIEVLASNDDRSGWIEIGIISTGGHTYDDALQRGRARAGEEGCDALAVLNVGVGGATATSWTGPTGSQELRLACLIVDERPAKPKPKVPKAQSASAQCNPACRDGYDCAFGECYPACNPPCESGQTCTGHGVDSKCN